MSNDKLTVAADPVSANLSLLSARLKPHVAGGEGHSCIKKLPNSRKGLQPWDSFVDLVPYQVQV